MMLARRRGVIGGAAGLVFALAAAAGGGCGYTTASSYAADVKSVAVPIFANQSGTRGLELDLTQAVIAELRRSTPYAVTTPESAQTILTGTITNAGLQRLTLGRDTGLAQDLAVIITVDFAWRDAATGKARTARRNFSAAENFVPASGARERLELGQTAAVQRLARDIVNEIRGGW
jgi:hypothetical protein